MKSIVFDAGPLISFTTNNLLTVAEELRKRFDGDFLIPESVKKEVVDRPLQIKRFEFEALQVQQQIDCGTFKVIPDNETIEMASRLMDSSNSILYAKDHPINIVHFAEMSVLAAAKEYKAEAVVVDERTTRELVEGIEHLAQRMKKKLGEKIKIDYPIAKELSKEINGIRIIRSSELAAVAYELGLLNKYIEKCRIPDLNTKKVLLDSVLWGLKLEGCAISKEEIEQIMKMEKL